jgi:hypothetical protein
MRWIIYLPILILPMFVQAQQNGLNTSTPGSWNYTGNQGFSQGITLETTLVFNPSGQPYVAYCDYQNSRKATVMMFNGTDWLVVGIPGFSLGQVFWLSLALDSNGVPYVAYADDSLGGRLTVMKFDGNNWVNLGSAGFSNDVVEYSSLSFSPDGQLYVAFQDWYQGSMKASVMKFNGNNWEYVGNQCFSTKTVSYTNLAFSPDGQPHIVFEEREKASVMKFDGNNWVYVGTPGFSAGQVAYTCIAFGPSGQLYVAYQDFVDWITKKVTVMKLNGNDWENVGTSSFSAGEADWVSLAIAHTGQPCVAYTDWGNSAKCTVMTFDGFDWVNVGSPGFTQGQAVCTSLAINPSGQPFVAFCDSVTIWKASVMNFDIPIGIHEQTNPKLLLYPNPSSTLLTIDFLNEDIGKKYYEIYNITGNNIDKNQTSETKLILDIKNYPTGMYFININTKNSNFVRRFWKN